MQQIINTLINSLGVNSTETHINMCLMLRNNFSVADVIEYVVSHLGSILTNDECVTFVQSLMDMDSAIVSVTLER